MPITATHATEDPPYVEIVDDRRGLFRRWLVVAMLRAASKRLRVEAADIDALREEQARVDLRLGGELPNAQISAAEGIGAQWLAARGSRDDRVVLYIHGGAFVFRYPRTHAAMVAPWCEALGARALMVDYRLAPESRFPAAPDDCHAAYRWLLDRGFAPGNIVIAGDSAGGNLTLATLHAISQAREPMPACAVLISPVADMTMSGATFVTHARRDPVFTLQQLIAFRGKYIAPEQMLDPRASPLFATFRGFPPLLFQSGSEEVLLDDACRAAARAHLDGVLVELEVWRRMPHCFQVMRTLPQAASAASRIVAFVARHTRWTAA